MRNRVCRPPVVLVLLVAAGLGAYAQLRPDVTVKPKPKKPPAAKVAAKPAEKPAAKPAPEPAQIIVETLPNAEVYLDDQYVGRASPQGRLVIGNLKAGEHGLRVSLAGKLDYEQTVTVVAGQVANVEAALEDLAPTAGPVKENPKDGLKYVWIPPGTFQMGCSPADSECDGDEKPAHRVTISKGFWIGQTEVTVQAFSRFVNQTGGHMPEAPDFNPRWSNPSMPIVRVSWHDAQAYCQWIGGRLPTEAEWEYAARGGSTQARYGALDEVARYSSNSGEQTRAVGQKRANGFGLYDMLGNVWEWVSDWYDEKYYQNSPSQDPSGASSGHSRVLRGGSWYSYPRYVRVSYRYRYEPDYRVNDLGFRCSREVLP